MPLGVALPPTSASPTLMCSVPPEPMPSPALEAALRETLFPVRIDDGQGHGPDPGSAEAKRVKRNRIEAECEQLPAHRYTWSQLDLNGDGTPEVVAQVVGPMFCGTGGCPLFIFREPGPGRLELITRVRVDAGTSTYAELQYDGRIYPTNPSVAPAIPLRRPEPGTAYLAWNEKDPRAHALPCADTAAKQGL